MFYVKRQEASQYYFENLKSYKTFSLILIFCWSCISIYLS